MEQKQDKHETNQPAKLYRGFTNLSAYEVVFPIVIHTVQLLQSCKRENKEGEFIDLIDKAQAKAVSVIASLADGYNKYHAEDKVVLYSKARSNVSHTQALVLILSALGVVPENAASKIVANFDEKMKVFNGLIRKMEDKA